jgi:hypothetical protein
MNKIKFGSKWNRVNKNLSSPKSSDIIIITKRYTYQGAKIAGSNPELSHLSIRNNIYPVRIYIAIAARVGKY